LLTKVNDVRMRGGLRFTASALDLTLKGVSHDISRGPLRADLDLIENLYLFSNFLEPPLNLFN
jgi:hypothetical protein